MGSQPFHPFLVAREDFFESLEHYSVNIDDFYSGVKAILPRGWECRHSGAWFGCGPTGAARPLQGWKLHVSATLGNARAVLDAASIVLVALEVPFKFALDRRILAKMNGRNWSRGGSGKFITAYPKNVDEFRCAAERLVAATGSYTGPYILSDRRVPGSKVVSYRYGGFARRRDLRLEGDFTAYVLAPDGTHVADVREPRFVVPPWTSDPYPQEADSDEDDALRDGRYEIKSVLSFSNAGGVYAAFDRHTGEEVVIKEARPDVAIGAEDYDAVASLQKEFRILNRLAGTGVAPEPIELFQEWQTGLWSNSAFRDRHCPTIAPERTSSSLPSERGRRSGQRP